MRRRTPSTGRATAHAIPAALSGVAGIRLFRLGLPALRAIAVRARLESALADVLSTDVRVYVRTELIRLDPEDTLDVSDVRRLSAEYERVDVILILTEIPRHRHGRPLVAEVMDSRDVGVVSLPTLGARAAAGRLVRVLLSCVRQMRPEVESGRSRVAWAQWADASDDSNRLLQSRRLAGGARTVLGMVHANDPWRIVPKLSSALAAAAAAGAFGVFYHSI